MFHEPSTWLIIAIVLTVATFVFTLVVWFLFARIRLAIGLIHESSK